MNKNTQETAWFESYALKLWDNGYRGLVPIAPDGRPAVQGFQRWAAGMSEETLETFVTRFRSHGIGGITGRLVAFDIDADDRGDADRARAVLREIAGETPLEVHGSNDVRGKLLYGAPLMFKGQKRPLYEVLAHGQYAALFGLHRKTLQPYRWRDESPLDVPFDQLPRVTEQQAAQWLEMLRPKTVMPNAGPFPEGVRNGRLFQEALRLADEVSTLDELISRLAWLNASGLFDPPLPDDEVRRTAGSPWRYRETGTLRRADDDPYIQFGRSLWDQLRDDPGVLLLLGDLMYAHGAEPDKTFAISAEAMASARGLSKNTLKKRRDCLVAFGILEQVQQGGSRRRPDGSGFDHQPNRYRWAPGALDRIRGRDRGSNSDRDITQHPAAGERQGKEGRSLSWTTPSRGTSSTSSSPGSVA